jgi:hypothetical protein
MSNGSDTERIYKVHVRGALDESWFELPRGMRMTFDAKQHDESATVLVGALDQAALRGLLTRLWDLNLLVLSVSSAEPLPAGS